MIRNRLEAVATGKRFPMGFERTCADIQSVTHGPTVADHCVSVEYSLKATIGIYFRCLPHEFNEANRAAATQLLHDMHRESLAILFAMETASYNGDMHEIRKLISDLRKEMVGE
jgi:hypothetical protein